MIHKIEDGGAKDSGNGILLDRAKVELSCRHADNTLAVHEDRRVEACEHMHKVCEEDF